jgi:trigger factor
MPAALKTTTTELPDSRVRVEVEVPSAALEGALRSAAADLGREMRVPGFRQGKVPAEVVLRQVGREAVLDEAVRRALPEWYEQAVTDAGITAVGDPKLDLSDLPQQGSPLSFSIEVGVVPPARLGEYRGLEVGRREPKADPDEVQAELERIRESLASLENVDRPAADGDFVVIDFVGRIDGEPFEGGEARGHLLELGSGRLIEGFEEQLRGASAGDSREVTVTFPDEYAAEHLAGREAVFAVDVKEIKEKRLPELDDELALEAGGFDTLDELRDDIRERLSEGEERRIEAEFREAVLDSAVANATIEVPDALVEARARELWDQMLHSLAHQGISKEMYLQISGRDEDSIVEEGKADAERQLKREAVLAAIVEAESIEPSEDEVLAALEEAAPSEQTSAKKLLERMKSAGRLDTFKAELANRAALDLLAESATPISVEQAQARDKLWTPGADAQGGSRPLWTPGS